MMRKWFGEGVSCGSVYWMLINEIGRNKHWSRYRKWNSFTSNDQSGNCRLQMKCDWRFNPSWDIQQYLKYGCISHDSTSYTAVYLMMDGTFSRISECHRVVRTVCWTFEDHILSHSSNRCSDESEYAYMYLRNHKNESLCGSASD